MRHLITGPHSILLLFLIGLLLAAPSNGQAKEIDVNERVDCWPARYPEDLDARKAECAKVGCVWDAQVDKYHPSVPRCYFPANQGYTFHSSGANGSQISLSWPQGNALKNPYSEPNLDIRLSTKQMGGALAVKIGREDRYTPPVPLNRDAKIASSEQLIFQQICPTSSDQRQCHAGDHFAFAVKRASDGQHIFDTSIGGMVFGDKFIQIATYLPSDRVYGFGENLHHQLKHDFTVYKTWGMFSRDQPEDAYNPGSVNEYGVHPFYMGLEPSGKAYGVLIFNSNAQEYTTGPAPHLIYRTIGGQLELFFFPGPTPEEVIRQYQQLIGRPYLPAFWAFGFHLCRFGYNSLDHVKAVVQRTREAKIPFDVQQADIDYMERYKDFTYDDNTYAGFGEWVEKELHPNGMKLILIFDPPVQVNYSSYRRAKEMGASFIEWPAEHDQTEVNDLYAETKGTKVMLGPMWPDYHSAFPDWLDPEGKTTKWWVEEFKLFRKQIPFDGLWIDMNEPSVFGTNEETPWYYKPVEFVKNKPHILPLKCPVTELDFPPYRTWNVYQHDKGGIQVSLQQNTLCMIGRMGRGKYAMYDTHSLFGWSEMVASQQALREATGGKRGAVISRSTFPSSGTYGGHWLGDNEAKWSDLRISIIGIQEFNMFGVNHVGADVCGFHLETNEELCLRWQQLGAFYSYYRNHNDYIYKDQDPAQWPSVALVTREANLFRYRHLPYLYSLHFGSTKNGGTVVRPVFFEFPHDPNTFGLSFQFMWGPAMLVVPVISANVDTVRGYLPQNATWYSMSAAHQYGAKMASGFATFNAPRDTPLPTFLRAGHIIPRQVPAMTTTETRRNPFQLLIGLAKNSPATGELFWDDGDTAFDDIAAYPHHHFQFKAESNAKQTSVHIERKHNGGKELKLPSLKQIELFGHSATPKLGTVKVNGKPVALDMAISKFDAAKSTLVVEAAQKLVDLNEPGPWTVQWENEGGEKPSGNGAVRGGPPMWIFNAWLCSSVVLIMLSGAFGI